MSFPSEALQTFDLSLVAPSGATGVQVTFSPTRSRLVQVAGPSDFVRAGGVELEDGLPRFGIRFITPIPAKRGFQAHISYLGEQLRAPLACWDGRTDEPPDPACGRRWQNVYAQREKLAMTNPAQAYLFELDRLTHPVLLHFCREVCRDERARRIQRQDDLAKVLLARLEDRFGGTAPPAVQDVDACRQFSAIFRQAATMLRQDYRHAGEVLEAFAAGYHRVEISVPNSSVIDVMSEPDSYFVFLFAEFGFACLEQSHPIDPDMWLSMLQSLVKIQSLYLERWTPDARTPMRVRDYQQPPPRPLAPHVVERITSEYSRIVTIEQLKNKVRFNLKMAGGYRGMIEDLNEDHAKSDRCDP